MQVYNGVWVVKSQNRTLVSPEPLASCRPSGLKATLSTASAWPKNTNNRNNINSREYENNKNLCCTTIFNIQTTLLSHSLTSTIQHWATTNGKIHNVSHTRNSCWTAIHRTNPENSLRLTNYRQSLLHRDWKSVKVTLQMKRKTSLQVRLLFRKMRIFFLKICIKSKWISNLQRIKKERKN